MPWPGGPWRCRGAVGYQCRWSARSMCRHILGARKAPKEASGETHRSPHVVSAMSIGSGCGAGGFDRVTEASRVRMPLLSEPELIPPCWRISRVMLAQRAARGWASGISTGSTPIHARRSPT